MRPKMIVVELVDFKSVDYVVLGDFEIDKLDNDQLVVLCTGSQGEPLSALARMANGEHKSLSINASDTVIISATPIPGNEKSVQAIINSLSKSSRRSRPTASHTPKSAPSRISAT